MIKPYPLTLKEGEANPISREEISRSLILPEEYKRVRENPSFKYYSDFECFHCNKIGHIAQNYPKKGQEYTKRINKKRHHGHLADEEEEEEGPPRKQAREEDA